LSWAVDPEIRRFGYRSSIVNEHGIKVTYRRGERVRYEDLPAARRACRRAIMNDFERRELRKEQALASIRKEVGWPSSTDDFDERITTDLMWNYITALESLVAAHAWVHAYVRVN
jgi:hypothetical protein